MNNMHHVEVNEFFFDQVWSDGLPVIPVTPEGVAHMLRGLPNHDPHEVIGAIPPLMGKATVERIAIAGLMAGCRPAYMPVLIAAVRAITDRRFQLQGAQGTTDGVAPLLVINGPITWQLGFAADSGCFGHGHRANATVGRAVNMLMLILGGAFPGQIKKSTLGQSGCFSFCIAENYVATSCTDCREGTDSVVTWEPFHVERGFDEDTSTVTAFPALPMSQVADDCSATATGILTSLCDSMAILGNPAVYRGSETLVTFPPELVDIFQQQGWSKADIKRYVHEHARRPIKDLRRGGEWIEENLKHLRKYIDVNQDSATIPAVHDPDDLHIVVAGGEGRWMALIPGWGYGSRAVTVAIDTGGA